MLCGVHQAPEWPVWVCVVGRGGKQRVGVNLLSLLWPTQRHEIHLLIPSSAEINLVRVPPPPTVLKKAAGQREWPPAVGRVQFLTKSFSLCSRPGDDFLSGCPNKQRTLPMTFKSSSLGKWILFTMVTGCAQCKDRMFAVWLKVHFHWSPVEILVFMLILH